MSSDVTQKLKGFIQNYLSSAPTRSLDRGFLIKVFFLITGLAAGYFMVMGTPHFIARFYSDAIDRVRAETIHPNHWPQRGTGKFVSLPVEGSAIDSPDEFVYFQTVLALLDEGISNRVNMSDVLALKRKPNEYEKIFRFYEERQFIIVQAMRELAVPSRINRFHRHLISSMEAQIRYYAFYTDLKIKKPEITQESIRMTRDRMEANREILNAWSLFLSYYTDLDAQTYEAVYERLTWMDLN